MSSFSTFANYRSALKALEQIQPAAVNASACHSGRARDLWRVGILPNVGATPTTATATSSATTGSMLLNNAGTGKLVVSSALLGADNVMTLILCDRLSHQGGLSGTVTKAQTTNLPTAALTRYTDGAGVIIGLSIWATVGTAGTTVTASYTNQAGTSGQVTQAANFGVANFSDFNRMIWLPFASGDSGARSVESVTLETSTGTAGNFGVTLFKPLVGFALSSIQRLNEFDLLSSNMFGGIPEIQDDACLFWVILPSAVTCRHSGSINFAEI